MSSKMPSFITIRPEVTLEPDRLYSIGQVAGLLDVTMRAIRFYCAKNLISASLKTSGRYFDIHNVRRLSLVLQGKMMGLSLQQVAAFMVDDLPSLGGPALVVPESLIRQEIDALTQRNEVMLAVISKSMLNRPRQDDRSSEPRQSGLALVG